MSGDAGGAILIGGALAGVAYLYLSRQAEAEPQFTVTPAQQPAPQQSGGGFNAAPALQWGLQTLFDVMGTQDTAPDWGGYQPQEGTIMNTNNSSNTGGGWLSNILGGLSMGTATANPNTGATAGAQAGNAGSILDLIGRAEAPGGYNTVYGGSRLQPPRPITTMTVGEVLNWQDRSVAAGSASSAAGRYQIIRGTLRSLVNEGHVSTGDTFDQATQDRLGTALMNRRGYSRYQAGQISAETFANNLAKEWAGLPVVSGSKRGRSYYAGDGLNGATVRPDEVLGAISGGWA